MSEVKWQCDKCSGSGTIVVTGMDHHPACDGSCGQCPIPVPEQEYCDECGGQGFYVMEEPQESCTKNEPIDEDKCKVFRSGKVIK